MGTHQYAAWWPAQLAALCRYRLRGHEGANGSVQSQDLEGLSPRYGGRAPLPPPPVSESHDLYMTSYMTSFLEVHDLAAKVQSAVAA